MNIQTFLTNILKFLNDTILPFLIALAFVFFLWNAVRYFIIGGASEESQTKAKTLAVWGVAAFVFILSLWGIVKLIVSGLNFDPNQPITPDYVQSKNTNYPDNDSGPGSNTFPTGLGE
jgi:predicted PurR-regulated permease PerM